MVFAQLSGAYWLEGTAGACRQCEVLFGNGGVRAGSAGGHWEAAPGWERLRVVMLPVAVLTVTVAVAVGARLNQRRVKLSATPEQCGCLLGQQGCFTRTA